jgi:hypothetical protein
MRVAWNEVARSIVQKSMYYRNLHEIKASGKVEFKHFKVENFRSHIIQASHFADRKTVTTLISLDCCED